MTNFNNYIPEIVDKFQAFLNPKAPYVLYDIHSLTHDLKKIEASIKKEIRENQPVKKDASLWLRFHENDTLATDIENINSTIRTGSKSNIEHLKECMEIAIKNPAGVTVNFS